MRLSFTSFTYFSYAALKYRINFAQVNNDNILNFNLEI